MMNMRTLFLALCVLCLCLLAWGCGGGGGGADTTPPVISNVSLSPSTFTFEGGATTVTAVVTDNATEPASLEVNAYLMDPISLEIIVGPAPLSLQSGNTYQGILFVYPNLTSEDRVYLVRVSATDAAQNTANNDSQQVTVPGLQQPPPQPT